MGCSAIGMLSLLCSLTTSSGIGSADAAPTPASVSATTAAPAPDFDVATSYGWHRFSELHAGASIVLVFEPGESTLASLEEALPALSARGVEIAAVTRDPDGANWERLERLGITYALYSDPNGHVAELFGLGAPALDPPASAWCLIDARGRIVDLHRGVDPDRLVAEIERALPASNVAGGDAMR